MSFEISSIKLVAKRSKFSNRPLVFVDIGSETLLQHLENRRQRPVNLFRQVARAALERVTERDASNLSMNWSQRAGCKCGCSPGFIVKGYHPLLHGNNVHVTFDQKTSGLTA